MSSRRKFVLSAAACLAGAPIACHALGIVAIGKREEFHVPEDSCNCHVHLIGPQEHYPMLSGRSYTPPEATVSELRVHLSALRMSRVVVIQPSFYGTDNRCLIDGLRQLGKMSRGVAVIDEKTSDAELSEMAKSGVRGARVNLESGGAPVGLAAKGALSSVAARVAPHGWHLQIYAASHVIAASADEIARLPVPVSLDHFAMLQAKDGVAQRDFAPIVELVRSGAAYVKLSGVYRVSEAAPDYEDVLPLAKALIEANPDRMLWASDWPHTDRAPGKTPTEVSPFKIVDDKRVLGLLQKWAPQEKVRRKILVENPARLYGF